MNANESSFFNFCMFFNDFFISAASKYLKNYYGITRFDSTYIKNTIQKHLQCFGISTNIFIKRISLKGYGYYY